MNAVKLYQKYSIEELQKMDQAIRDDPKNHNPEHLVGKSIWIYTKQARKKMDAIGWAITWHLRDRREATGDPVGQVGYTGRKTNK